MDRRAVKLGLALTILFVSVTAWAQTVDVDVPDPSSENGRFFVRAGYGHRFDADLKDGPGQFSTDDARLELGGAAVFGDVTWANAFGYGYNHYNSDLVGADIHNFLLSSIVGIKVARSCSIMVGPVAGLSAEDDADWGDALSYGGLIGSSYRHSPSLSLGLSVVVLRRIEQGVGIVPVPMVNWRFARDWQLYTGLTDVAARRGIGGFIAWSFAKNWEAATGVQFEHRRFRLDAGDAIGEDKSVPVYVRIGSEMIEGLKLDAMAGAGFGGEVELNDSNDHFLGDRKYKPAPLVGLRLQYALSDL